MNEENGELMMRRKIAILVLTALLLGLLGGCVRKPAQTEPTDAPSAAAATLQPPSEYTVTPGGVSVRTDYGAYTAGKSEITPNFTRLSADALPELTARDDYGALYLYGKRVGDEGSFSSVLFGFADTQGRIVTDPVYSYASQLWNADRTQGLWSFRKVIITGYETYPDGTYPLSEEIYGLAALDGSFVIDTRYIGIRAGDNVVLCLYPAEEGERQKFDVYNYAGKLLCTSADMPYADRLTGEPWKFSCLGDYLIVGLDSGEFEDWGDGEQHEVSDIYLSTLDGELRAGPFSYAPGYSGGYLNVTQKDGTSALVTPEGELLFGRGFYAIAYNAADRFSVQDAEGEDYRVLDAAGNEIFRRPSDNGYLYWDGGCYIASDLSDYGYTTTLLDRDGKPYEGLDEGDWNMLSGTHVASAIAVDGIWKFYNVDTGESRSLSLGADGYANPCCYYGQTRFPYFYTCTAGANRNYAAMDTVVYDERFQAVLSFRGSCYTFSDMKTGTPYFAVKADGKITLYSAEMEPVFTAPLALDGSLLIADSILSIYDAQASRSYDLKTGQELLCYPLYNLLDD